MTIAYLDTSSLVKLYIQEEGSEAVRDLLHTADALATSVVAYPEARAAFSRRYHEGGFDSKGFSRIKHGLDEDWPHYAVVQLTPNLAIEAGEIAEIQRVRGFDAIHLASALALQEKLTGPMIFSCFDRRLNEAAKQAGLDTGRPGSIS